MRRLLAPLLALLLLLLQASAGARRLQSPLPPATSPLPPSPPLQSSLLSSPLLYHQSARAIHLLHCGGKKVSGQYMKITLNKATKTVGVSFPELKTLPASLKGNRNSAGEAGEADAVLGIFKAGSIHYLGLVTKSSPCESFVNAQKVEEVKFLPIMNSKEPLSTENIREFEVMYSSFRRHDFFFSKQPNLYDITRTTQGNARTKTLHTNITDPSALPLYEESDDRFFWNRNTIHPIIQAIKHQYNDKHTRNAASNVWIKPIMNAIVSSCAFELNNQLFKLVLVSRRSRDRQGPRLLVRGINRKGNVANFVETEQILTCVKTQNVASFVQVRGSIPLFWKQPDKFMPKPRLLLEDKLISENTVALHAHLKDLYRRYVEQDLSDVKMMAAGKKAVPSIVLLNLIDKCDSQGVIGRHMMRVLNNLGTKHSANNIDPLVLLNRSDITLSNYKIPFNFSSNQPLSPALLRHVWYDFHHHHQRPALQKLPPTRNILLALSDVLLSNDSFFLSANLEGNRKVSSFNDYASFNYNALTGYQQTNVIRTNCVDSLDRTNVAQSEIAREVLLRQLGILNLLNSVDKNSDLSSDSTLPKEVEKKFRKMWSRNGDKISMLYSGTRALKQDFVRKGRRTLKGILKDASSSMKRYFLNIFVDKERYHGVNLVIGNSSVENISLSTNESTNTVVPHHGNTTDSTHDVFNVQELFETRTSRVMAALDRLMRDKRNLVTSDIEAKKDRKPFPVRLNLHFINNKMLSSPQSQRNGILSSITKPPIFRHSFSKLSKKINFFVSKSCAALLGKEYRVWRFLVIFSYVLSTMRLIDR